MPPVSANHWARILAAGTSTPSCSTRPAARSTSCLTPTIPPRDRRPAQPGWDNTLLDELKSIPVSDFEAVDTSSMMIDPNSGAAR